ADRVRDDQAADPGDDQHHEDGERVDQDAQVEVVGAGGQPAPERRWVRAVVRRVAEQEREGDDGRDEGDADRRSRQVARAVPGQPPPGEGDRQRRAERREQADPGGGDHPRRVRSLSTSKSSLRRAIATISPSPTTTSEAATAITVSAKICPSPRPWKRENAISARFAPLSISSSESSTISGLRRISTPSAPVKKRNAATQRYQVTAGPFTRRPSRASGCRGSPRRPLRSTRRST